MRILDSGSYRQGKRRLFILAIGLIAIVMLIVLTFFDIGTIDVPGLYPVYFGGWRQIPFEKKVWDSAQEPWPLFWGGGPARDNRRARMVNDLLSHHLRKGMTKIQVERVIGRPMAGGDGIELYDILEFPSVDQKIVAWLRWGSARPTLVLTYRGETNAEKLASAKIER